VGQKYTYLRVIIYATVQLTVSFRQSDPITVLIHFNSSRVFYIITLSVTGITINHTFAFSL